jgi:hypothetical protein
VSTLEMSGVITARSTKKAKSSTMALQDHAEDDREVVYGPAFDTRSHGGRRSLDLDQ